MPDKPTYFIVGCGDIGKRVAKKLISTGNQVHALTHNNNTEKLTTLGIKPHIADLDDSQTLAHLKITYDYIFYFAPPPREGTTDTRMQHFIQTYLRHYPCKRLLYISTTGVYGDQQAQWINEETPVAPQVDRAKRRLDAEQQITLFHEQYATEFVIIRVAGIYSLEKLPINRLQQGITILDRKLSGASNRIHADDLTNICLTAIHKAESAEIFNATDGQPSTMSDYFIKVAAAFDLPTPVEVDWQYAEQHFSTSMLSYLKESKKISNNKLKKLGIQLQYPSLEAGLKQCLEESYAM